MQALAVGAVVLAYLRRGSSPAALPAAATAALFLFMIANPVVWPYYYAPAVIAGLLAVKCFPSESRL